MTTFEKFLERYGVRCSSINSFNPNETKIQFFKPSNSKDRAVVKDYCPNLAVGFWSLITYAYPVTIVEGLSNPANQRPDISSLEVPGTYYVTSTSNDIPKINEENWERGIYCHGMELHGKHLVYRIA